MVPYKEYANLSPTLFNIYLNDLAKELKELELGVSLGDTQICILLYADDIVLISETEQNLQKMLDHVGYWCNKWQMKVNIDKIKIIHFRNKRKPVTKYEFKINNCKINLTGNYRYLGVIFDEYLTFELCARTLAESGGRALSSIISEFKQFKNIGYHTFTKLYDTGVNSIISYGASVWGYGNDKFGQMVQNRAMRYFLDVHKNAPTHAVQADMGWISVKFQHFLCILRFENRLLKMKNDRLRKRVAEFQLININNSSWFNNLYDILESVNKSHYLIEEKEIDLTDIKFELSDLMHEEWSNTVGYKPKLRSYVKFKQNINVEDYVISNISRSHRSLLAQLRMGILPLNIETGRYIRKELNERLCLLCNQNSIEDEHHFLLLCPVYNAEDDNLCKLIPSFNHLIPDEQLCILMNLKSKYLANFIESIWNKRKKFFFEASLNS